MVNDKSFSACNPPLSYQDAIDQMAEMVAENKRCEYSFDESLQCIMDIISKDEDDDEKMLEMLKAHSRAFFKPAIQRYQDNSPHVYGDYVRLGDHITQIARLENQLKAKEREIESLQAQVKDWRDLCIKYSK